MKNLLYILCLFSFQFAFAQSELPESFADYKTIPNPEKGKGYVRVIIPTEFEINVERKRLCLLANNKHLLKNLNEGEDYEIRAETIVLKPKHKTYEVKSPNFHKNSHIRFYVSESNWESIDSLNPNWQVGDTIIQDLTIKSAYVQFLPFYFNYKEYGQINKGCLSANPKMAIVWTNKYFRPIKIRQQKVIHQINGQYQLETLADIVRYGYIDYIFDTVYQLIEIVVPQEIDTFKVVHFHNENTEKVISTISIPIHKIVKPAYISDWFEIVCPTHCGPLEIIRIQRALKELGYDVPLDNVFDIKTKKALIQFQKDYNLPIGQLDNETLGALDVY